MQITYWTTNLRHEDPFARAWAARLVHDNARYFRGRVENWMEAIPALAEMIGDVDWLVREESAQSLHTLVLIAEGEARGVTPELIQALKKIGKKPDPPWSFYEQNVLGSLGAIGPDAQATVPVLLMILQDEESEFRARAASVLEKIDPKAAPPTERL